MEHRTRKTNVELASHQLELISEILELKNIFFQDQARIHEGAKLNRKLEKNIELLKLRVSSNCTKYNNKLLRSFGFGLAVNVIVNLTYNTVTSNKGRTCIEVIAKSCDPKIRNKTVHLIKFSALITPSLALYNNY